MVSISLLPIYQWLWHPRKVGNLLLVYRKEPSQLTGIQTHFQLRNDAEEADEWGEHDAGEQR